MITEHEKQRVRPYRPPHDIRPVCCQGCGKAECDHRDRLIGWYKDVWQPKSGLCPECVKKVKRCNR